MRLRFFRLFFISFLGTCMMIFSSASSTFATSFTQLNVLKDTANSTHTAVTAATQSQTNLPYPLWWNGTLCDTTKVANSTPLGTYYRGMPACGPVGLPTDPAHEVIFPGGFGEYEWQCVELSMRFMYLAYGIPAYDAPTGTYVVDNYQQHNPNNPILVPIQNTNPSTTDTVPQPGDILSYYTNHTGVVTATNVINGNGTLTVIEQNASSNGKTTVKVGSNAGLPPWVLDTKIKNWLHHTVDITPQTSVPTAKVNVSGSGFGANETVTIKLDGTQIGTATTDSTGILSTTITIPKSAQPGAHSVQFTGLTSGFSPRTVLYVQTDWAMFGFNPQSTRYNPYENTLNLSNVSKLTIGWTGVIGSGISTAPSVVNGIIYVGTYDGKLYAFSASASCATGGGTCPPLWTGITVGPISSTPAVANRIVYVTSTNDGKFSAFSASGCGQSTCSPLWTANVQTGSYSSPVVVNGIVYVGNTYTNMLYAFKAAGCGSSTCSPLWTGVGYGYNNASPVVANGMVYMYSANGFVAFNANGCGQPTCQPLWTISNIQPDSPSAATPVVANGTIYVPAYSTLYVLDAKTGQQLWTGNYGGPSGESLAVANGFVYSSSWNNTANNNIFYVFNAKGCGQSSCSPIWTTTLPNILTAPTVANGIVYIGTEGSSGNNLVALKAAGCGSSTCSPVSSINIPKNFSWPTVVNGWVYLGSQCSNCPVFYALHLST